MELRDGIDDENGDDALEEPAGEESKGLAAQEDGPPGEDAEGARRRRRRRRGRRGRGRGRAENTETPDAAGSNGNAPVVPPRAPSEDEPSVPRGVVAHELMPAATGGRRRGRRGGRGRRGYPGGEPVDPQLISPSNPVPKPGFDED